jgi:CheY-like chemotaxis protein
LKKILVIEDNDGVRENLAEILELSGYEVVSAPNGKEGVSLAKSEQPDLILCDVSMPQLDGFGVLKILNRESDTFDIPFIFLTARVEPSDFRKGMGLGADDYITKPFDDTELLEAVETRLKKNERLRAVIKASGKDKVQQLFSESRALETLKEVSDQSELRTFQAKECIYEQGRTPRYLYFIEEGRVKLSKVNEIGKELITHVYSREEFFGYNPLLRDVPYEESANALEESKIRLIPKEDFRELLLGNREFTAHFIKILATEASITEQQLIDLAYSSVRKKTANALLSLVEGELTDQPVTIVATRDDLASVAGTAKETLIRTLSDFKSEGLIAIQGSKITLLDIESLTHLPQ